MTAPSRRRQPRSRQYTPDEPPRGLTRVAKWAILSNVGARDESAAGPPSSTAAGFSYTDARGKKIDLPTVPTVVVAQSSAAAALWDFGFKVKGAYGELKTTDATWKAQPAVKSGQVFDWKPAAPYSYLASAPLLEAFATALTSSEGAA